MNPIKKIVIAVSLATVAGFAPAQDQRQPYPASSRDQNQTVVQDGIQVRPMSRFRGLAPKQQIEAQSRQQYTQLVQQAAQKGALVSQNDPQVQRLRAIARRIIPQTTRWNADASRWDWQVNLFAADQVNAFCMPGGRIGFFTGILGKLRLTDDEVAAIMGHEIAHALREHSSEQYGKAVATQVGSRVVGGLLASVFGIDPGITDTVARYGSQALSLKYSRDDEREADLIGLDLAARAGFDPRAGISLWEKMAAQSRSAPPAFLSTHPGGRDRIAQMNAHMDVLLPLYARAKGVSTRQLPPYRPTAYR